MAALHVIDADDSSPVPGVPEPEGSAEGSPEAGGAVSSEAATWWTAWGGVVQIAVTDRRSLRAARRLARRELAATEKAAYRHRPDAEIHALYRAGGRAITVSPLLAELVSAALTTAERTGGDVDPTVAAAVTRLVTRRPGGVIDLRAAVVPACSQAGDLTRGAAARLTWPVAGWETVRLDGRRLQVPAGVTLDLTATAKAVSADRAARQIADRLGIGVSVAIGGYVATAGPAPSGGWLVHLEGGERVVALPAGAAVATARAEGLVDPRTGEAVDPVWSSVTALGLSCLEASGHAAAAVVRGTSARAWLTELGVPARLVTADSDALAVAGWDRHARTDTTWISTAVRDDGPENPHLRGVPAPRLANPQRTNIR